MSATLTVLVVEDEEAFIDALEVGLGREGFDVKVARDGAEALEMFDRVGPGPRAVGRDAPEHLGSRRVPGAASANRRADHHGHRQVGRDRHRRRSRGGRR
ncbi:MAG: hypothetical protein V9E94_18810 [Microthrixaceae bacterium]